MGKFDPDADAADAVEYDDPIWSNSIFSPGSVVVTLVNALYRAPSPLSCLFFANDPELPSSTDA